MRFVKIAEDMIINADTIKSIEKAIRLTRGAQVEETIIKSQGGVAIVNLPVDDVAKLILANTFVDFTGYVVSKLPY